MPLWKHCCSMNKSKCLNSYIKWKQIFYFEPKVTPIRNNGMLLGGAIAWIVIFRVDILINILIVAFFKETKSK